MLLSYKPLHLEAQQRLQEEGCVVDITGRIRRSPVTTVAVVGRGLGGGRGCHRSPLSVPRMRESEEMEQIKGRGMRFWGLVMVMVGNIS